jgi:hypothetical protein
VAFSRLREVEKKETRHRSIKVYCSQRGLEREDGFGRAEAKDLLPRRQKEVGNPPQNA